MINGTDICAIPANEIYEKVDQSYGYVAPNGYKLVHPCMDDVIGRVKDTIRKIDTIPEFSDNSFDK